MSNQSLDVKLASTPRPPAVTGTTSPGAYNRWRATMLGRITEGLEQRCVIDLVGAVGRRRVLDLGCGDGLLVVTLAARGAVAVGIDADRSMLSAAVVRGLVAAQPARFLEGRIEQLPFPDHSFDVVTAVTVLCLVPDQAAAVREAARVLRPGGRLVIGDLGRWNAWAARRRVKAWFGSRLWRSAHFSTAAELSRLTEDAGLTVDTVRGSVYYPPIGLLARALAPLDQWLGSVVTTGAAFVAVAATKPSVTARLGADAASPRS